MKKILSLMVALIVATLSYAQSGLLATLSHNGEITTYYGASALSDAHNDADHGDIITLSSGSFNAVNITKAITLRGAGMEANASTQTEATILVGDFTLYVPSEVPQRLTIEGIYSNNNMNVGSDLKNASFLKCRFNVIRAFEEIQITNLTMIHCKVTNYLYFDRGSASIINSVIRDPKIENNANIEYVNSIITRSSQFYLQLGFSQYKNSILVPKENARNNYLYSFTLASYCVSIGSSGMFVNIPEANNNVEMTCEEVFKTYKNNDSGTFADDETFELTDEAKTTLLGLDGTQVGIHGGNMPFSAATTNPQITRCNVAAKSTADGKLSVDITVSVPE